MNRSMALALALLVVASFVAVVTPTAAATHRVVQFCGIGDDPVLDALLCRLQCIAESHVRDTLRCVR